MFAKTVLALLAIAAPALAATCSRSYTVQEGDICDSISAAQNVSTYQLAVANSNIDPACSNLLPGETLCLGNEGEDCSTTYVVKADDTCDTIGGVAGVNSTMLTLNNPQINQDCTNLYIGEVLCVANAVQVPAAPSTPVLTSIPATATPVLSTVAASTSVAVTTTASAAEASETDDDEDLPWCDEL
ncbi:hypothetical protein PUNSTDRAFT_128216 [Punctularia strigosozonata HHB-11173 SS5]|uniref:LysM domain-containing protein n=1 Tax=Punctularia strigosozonata (strain HHB-11173) TaxID=741275 RepID=R7S355_PUNST|nr:uncharacterized protein PUNSTDRAFT_128216 [Punctularia strigosozonata HHB-11173 SS5]EIN04658.1 hypothetical protein PUNSTDRAFT_128216 [Punctularia strigosozonata HHB-11173 SS5]